MHPLVPVQVSRYRGPPGGPAQESAHLLFIHPTYRGRKCIVDAMWVQLRTGNAKCLLTDWERVRQSAVEVENNTPNAKLARHHRRSSLNPAVRR